MTSPLSLPLLKELFNYNYWARNRQLQACAVLTEEQFTRPLANSFPSLRDTFTHLVGVELLWLDRWRGFSPMVLLSPEEFPNLIALSANWRTVESEMKMYLAQLGEEALELKLSYVNMKGETRTYPLWRMMLNLINHQTYHRGQVASLLRQLGIQPPGVDFLVGQDMGYRL
jgi:uncharacterized damage-inducible protein DinB